jgi:hypothetical protein
VTRQKKRVGLFILSFLGQIHLPLRPKKGCHFHPSRSAVLERQETLNRKIISIETLKKKNAVKAYYFDSV